MATIHIALGDASYACWMYLQRTGVEYTNYRLYTTESANSSTMLFEIDDDSVAAYCALRFSSHPS